MTAAIALPRRPLSSVQPAFQGGSGTAVRTATGSVGAIFALEGYDRRHRVAMYALRIANDSKATLLCRVWIISNQGAATLAYPVSLEVEPFAQKSTAVPVWMDDCGSFSRAVAEIVGEGVDCVVEAAAPVQQGRGGMFRIIAAVAGGVASLVVAGAVAIAAVPRIDAFAAPPMAMSGTTVAAEYSASGAGRLSYDVIAPDGRRVGGGELADRTGSLSIAIPPSIDNQAYTVALTMRGLLGTTKEVRAVNGVAPKVRNAAAQISDISVNPAVAKAGQTVNVAYAASGDAGYVRLVGGDGALWAQKPFSRGGLTAFTIPSAASGSQMRVLLHVTKGRSAAESSAGLVVANQAVAAVTATALRTVTNDGSAAGAIDGGANGTFEVVSRRVKGGHAIDVRILSPRNGMRIALTDTQSREVTGVNVGSDKQTVTLRAPVVAVATRYTVVADFTDGFGQESIVQPITITP